ncbi:hypothetical protein WEH80_38705 [Actinomycetes bacterium KLBMP 9759]
MGVNTPDLILVGLSALAVAAVAVRSRARSRRMRLAADIARAGTRSSSLIGRVLLVASVLVGVQWLVMTHSDNQTLKWMVLAVPALVSAFAVVKALTVTHLEPQRRRAGGRR